jgi:5'-3' exonuclease
MGIPSYFSFIVKNYAKIIVPLNNAFFTSYFYLDCNSIIYNELHKMDAQAHRQENIELDLINRVCETIQLYIHNLKPSKLVYISFDGVAPAAKMKQQKIRRYKSDFEKQVLNDPEHSPAQHGQPGTWNTSAITPGTAFMTLLHTYIGSYKFKTNAKIIISSSYDVGEGEHKIFQHIRNNHKIITNSNVVVYGLDADLIMLALNHLHMCEKIYLYRETPHFISSLNASLDPDKLYICDIPRLCTEISQVLVQKDMAPRMHVFIPRELKYAKIRDYIFLGFLLGNDFMPHFPSVNIRTNGIQHILNTYFLTVATNETIVGLMSDDDVDDYTYNDPTVNWKILRKFIIELSKKEHQNLCDEYTIRKKQCASFLKRYFRNKDNDTGGIQNRSGGIQNRSGGIQTTKDKAECFTNLPIVNRQIEDYIDPFSNGWQERYYASLFDVYYKSPETIYAICINYFEGLEWNLKYYTVGCCDWRWSYKYDYPPLFSDLLEQMPYFDTEFMTQRNTHALHPYIQLSYVLPPNSHYLLPAQIRSQIKPEWYDNNCKFRWAFCKYFWEAHVEFPFVSLEEIENSIDLAII